MMELRLIRDYGAPELDVYARLTEGQLLNRAVPEEGLFIAESPYVIRRALDAGYEPVSFLAETKLVQTQVYPLTEQYPGCADLPVYAAEPEVLRQLTGFPMTRGILCAMRRKALPAVEEICRDAHCVVILEEIENPTNLGAIFRSAAALGADAVLLTPGCTNPFYRRAARVSMGTVFQIPWTFIPDKPGKRRHDTGRRPEAAAEAGSSHPEDCCRDCSWPDGCLTLLREMGFASMALALSDDSIPIDAPVLDTEEKIAIVLGTEGDGLAAKTIAGCDYTVRIPMAHGVDSLNVAAAGAVALYRLAGRNRQAPRQH